MLKSGYTTGVHTVLAFKSALEIFLKTKEKTITKTIKMDNDDLDVTKGCEIIVTLSLKKQELDLNPQFHNPQIINNFEIYAGVGVGVVTKKGLKIEPNFPAINPKPLSEIKKQIEDLKTEKIYCSISVTNGAEIALKTANSKVGIFGGISILGTTGIVKPISNIAYLESIKTEIDFIEVNGYESIVLTIGNNSLEKAKKSYKTEQIVEIGNFVDDAIQILKNKRFKKVILIAGIGKITKIAQGFKNTHNRFGDIDFKILEKWLKEDLTAFMTVKSISENFVEFDKIVLKKAKEKIGIEVRLV